MTIAATVVRDQQSSALASVVRGREEARNSATAYIFITLWGIVKKRSPKQFLYNETFVYL